MPGCKGTRQRPSRSAPAAAACRFVGGQHPGKLQRKALALLRYCLRKQPADCEAACQAPGLLPGLVAALQQQQDDQLREAALQVGALGGRGCELMCHAAGQLPGAG
jgi:hypothetical protein